MTDKNQTKVQARANDKDQTRQPASLDACYGRIGIPAVAAALTPRHDERHRPAEPRFTPYDRD
jgi:hypothetical protein